MSGFSVFRQSWHDPITDGCEKISIRITEKYVCWKNVIIKSSIKAQTWIDKTYFAEKKHKDAILR